MFTPLVFHAYMCEFRLERSFMTGAEFSRGRGWFVAVVATLAMSVSYVDRQALAALAPTVKDALHINHTQYGWLTSAFSMTYLVGAPLAGLVVDRIGARRGLAYAVVAWTCVAAGHALVPTFGALFALRIALGLTESPSFPGAAQAVKRSHHGRDREAGFGMLFTGSSIGAMIAGPAAIALKVHYGWQRAFVGVALLGALWIPLWLVASGGPMRKVLSQGADSPDASTIGQSLAEIPKLLGKVGVVRALLLVFGSAPAIMFVLNWFPQYLEARHHIPQDDLGHYVWFPPLLFDLGAVGFGVLAGRLAPARRERGPTVLVALAGVLASTIALSPLAPDAASATLLAGVSLSGGGALFALLTADMLARVEPRLVSRAGGLTAAAQSLVYIVANPIVGKVIDRTHDYRSVTVALGLLVVPGVLAWIALGRADSRAAWRMDPRLE
ncbi:MAG: D-galactonate transporter [Myxococcaceae bacterium]|nr:D-galactonate transporter [Myxococcaceae bacterium]